MQQIDRQIWKPSCKHSRNFFFFSFLYEYGGKQNYKTLYSSIGSSVVKMILPSYLLHFHKNGLKFWKFCNFPILTNSLMFWTNLDRNHPKIERASLDGTDHTILFSTGLGELGALTADYKSNRLFWADTFLDEIITADIAGK